MKQDGLRRARPAFFIESQFPPAVVQIYFSTTKNTKNTKSHEIKKQWVVPNAIRYERSEQEADSVTFLEMKHWFAH